MVIMSASRRPMNLASRILIQRKIEAELREVGNTN